MSFAANTQPEKLTVVLDWFVNPDHAPLVVADQQGFFKEQGLKVNLIGPSDPTDPPKWVVMGRADIGITYQPEFMQQVDQSLPIISIGTLIDQPLNSLVTLKDSGINTPADLKGKRIGSSYNTINNVILRVMLAKVGLAETDVELVNVRYNLTQALLSHKVDAVTGMMRNYEVPLLELQDKKVIAFFPEEYGIPTYSELVFIINTKNKHDKRIPRFLMAVKKAVRFIDEHPQEAWEGFAKQYPESNNRVNRQAWFATMPYFNKDPASFDREEWLHFANFMKKNQLIKKVQPLSRYLVQVS
jgi:putative hydroxymethylpyrimidine transport system substrate-binding protein